MIGVTCGGPAAAACALALEGTVTPPPAGTTYKVERWRDLRREMLPLLVQHWKEIALNHAAVPLDIDHEKYDALDKDGALHIVTVRQDGELVGYHVAIISGHLHYKSTLHGITDVYWLAPAHRQGFTGIRLFRHVEKEMAALGVRKLFTGTKVHLDMSKLFEHLGYKRVEYLYAKLIGD
ncbi:GNAT family N-acetyltransferase [Variovorax paradoxus]|uniref:GNAT family N-acetyltransferase n=1 Tax=Variovorax paradoxus TaxID=34073 RepID=UPI0019315194|nr:GNAT family N-acetyltransferase [Variovorax paradoxus]